MPTTSSRSAEPRPVPEHHYTASVEWRRREAERFTDGRYSRGHVWRFDGGVEVPGSSAPSSVPLPYSRADAVDPEEALVAAVSSCHMLFFLSRAAKAGFVVESYCDEASGSMAPNAAGRIYVNAITLRPAVAFAGERVPDEAELNALHHEAHEACYIANSVRAAVTVVPQPAA